MDDALLILGVKILVSDHEREMDSLSCVATVEELESTLTALSTSEFEPRCLKPNFGIKLMIEGFPLAEGGSEDSFGNESLKSGVKRKFTLLGVGIGVGGMFICTTSGGDSSAALVGISRKRFGFLHCVPLPCDVSSIISEGFSI